MALKFSLLILFLCYLSRSCNGVSSKKLSKQEDLELEKELKRLNKPAVETILTTYGETYDCVDFYKQPAFDNPLLKNHSYHFQMKPTFVGKGKSHNNFTSIINPKLIWKNGKGCPFGTVPIKRVTKDDLLGAKLAAEMYASHTKPQTIDRPGVHFAVVHTPPDPSRRYFGAGMIAAIVNPKLRADSQYSSSHLRIQGGFDSFEFGWTVYPGLYKDRKTRFYIYTDTGDKQCFNTMCAGFVLVRSDFPLDHAFAKVSSYGKISYAEPFSVYRDIPGNWNLQVNFDSDYRATVGFWPAKIFRRGLASSATYVEWGGQVYSPKHIPSPQMGYGYDLLKPYQAIFDAFDAQITIFNESGQEVEVDDLQTYADIGNYKVVDGGYVTKLSKHTMWYGGKGGYIEN